MDVGKVVKSIEEAIQHFSRYSGDEYGREYDYARVEVDVLEDALALLKAQEQDAQREYEAAVEMAEYCERYEQTYDPETGAM